MAEAPGHLAVYRDMPDRFQVLRLLADGDYHSGETLAARLGVSRTAIWKRIQALGQYGLEVQAAPGRGYRLGYPIELLDPQRIWEGLTPAACRHLGALEVLIETDSTNQRLIESVAADPGAPARACLAEYQRAGRGRRGNRWVAPIGAGLCLSLLWRFDASPVSLIGLSLAAGAVLMRALESLGASTCGLKWPNDLYWEGRKLGGILVEVRGEADGPCSVIIGVGVNVALPAAALEKIDQPCADLVHVLGQPPSRNALAAAIINGLCDMLPDCQHKSGLQRYFDIWRQYDVLRGRTVRVRLAHGECAEGQAQAIDSDGALVLATAAGLRRFFSGEVSVRAA